MKMYYHHQYICVNCDKGRNQFAVITYILCWTRFNDIINPLSSYDALKHHITSLETHLIFPQLRVLKCKFLWNWFTNTCWFYFIFSPTSNHLHPLQVENYCNINQIRSKTKLSVRFYTTLYRSLRWMHYVSIPTKSYLSVPHIDSCQSQSRGTRVLRIFH